MQRLVDVAHKMKDPSKGDGLSACVRACDDPFIISKGCYDVRVLRGRVGTFAGWPSGLNGKLMYAIGGDSVRGLACEHHPPTVLQA